MKAIGVIGVGNTGPSMSKALRQVDFAVVARDLWPEAGLAAVDGCDATWASAQWPCSWRFWNADRTPRAASCCGKLHGKIAGRDRN